MVIINPVVKKLRAYLPNLNSFFFSLADGPLVTVVSDNLPFSFLQTSRVKTDEARRRSEPFGSRRRRGRPGNSSEKHYNE